MDALSFGLRFNTNHLNIKNGKNTLRWSKRRSFQRFSRLAKRLLGMNTSEIATRLKLRVRNSGGRNRYVVAQHESASNTAALFLSVLGENYQERVVELFDSQFFFGPGSRKELVACFKRQHATHVGKLIQDADQIIHDGFELLGQNTVTGDKGVDWHIDPQTGQSPWPTCRWMKVPQSRMRRTPSMSGRSIDISFSHHWDAHIGFQAMSITPGLRSQ